MISLLPTNTVFDLDISMMLGGFGKNNAGIRGMNWPGTSPPFIRAAEHTIYRHRCWWIPPISDELCCDGSINPPCAAANSELEFRRIGNLDDSAPLIRYGHLSAEDRKSLLQSAQLVMSLRAFLISTEGQ